MKAILIKNPGGAEQLYMGEAEIPALAKKEILVKVKATSLNRMDIIQREGRYPVPKGASPVLGVDVAGVVEELGLGCSKWKPGDRVMGLLSGGAYAEYVSVHEDLALPIPENLSFEGGAAIPEVFMTGYQTLFFLGKTKAGYDVLIHAGASGVGTAAIQLVREVGARSIVTAGSPGKIEFCKKLGAWKGFNYREGPFAEKVLEATQGKGVDVILDFVGASFWEQNIQSLKREGRLIVIGYLGGSRVTNMDLTPILRNWVHILGTTLRARDRDYQIGLVRELSGFALDRFKDGRLKPVIDKVYPWERVQEAHRYMEANRNIGKIVMNGM